MTVKKDLWKPNGLLFSAIPSFRKFLSEPAKYDVVVDGLNVSLGMESRIKTNQSKGERVNKYTTKSWMGTWGNYCN